MKRPGTIFITFSKFSKNIFIENSILSLKRHSSNVRLLPGVYKLRWIEKKLTNTMYGAPPSASFEEVVESFLKAEDLAPGFYKANRLYLAKVFRLKKY